ncbi:hypothetical protein [Aeromonas sp.]|uniref:hypothetical protein n=1 Tax=Aeromonas sp. TaxID=647 RepID=UPI0025840D6F|nr:hypothetical protein [Aeromonas sp.]
MGLYDELPYAAHIVTSWVILEAQIDLADLMLFGMTFKMQSADALARLVAFVVEVMTQEGSVGLQSRLRSLLQGTASNPATEAEASLVAFAKAPSFPLAIEALRAFRVTAAHGYRTQPALAAETDGTAAAPVVQRQQPTLPPKLPWSSYSLSASANGSGCAFCKSPERQSTSNRGTIQFSKQFIEGRSFFLCHRENSSKMRRYLVDHDTSPQAGSSRRSKFHNWLDDLWTVYNCYSWNETWTMF